MKPLAMSLSISLLLILPIFCPSFAQEFPSDRECGSDLSNLWLDVVVVVDNSVGMTNDGLIQVAAQIVSVFSAGTRIGTNYADKRTTRVGLVTYNEVATIKANLSVFQSSSDLFASVFDNLQEVSTSDTVYLAKGLEAAEKVLAEGRNNNIRANYKQLVIIYASDYNDEGMEDPRPTADRLKASGVNIATVSFDQTGNEGVSDKLGEISTPSFNFSNKDNNLVREIQTAMIQTNCYCSNLWHQYRDDYDDQKSYKYGVCLMPVAITAAWAPARLSCQNMIKAGYMVTEYNEKKHNYVFRMIQNNTAFREPYIYHIGLSNVNGGYFWQQPAGSPLVPLDDVLWNPGFPQQPASNTGVVNQQQSSAFKIGWQNINQYTVAEKYVCEVASCDTDKYCE